MGKLRHILGNILFQGLILTLAALGYMVYRVIFHQDICMAILLVAIELAQTYAPRTQFIIDFVRYFEPIKMFAYQEIIAEEPTEKSNTLYSIHPHGIFNYSTLMNLYTPNTYFENITILASRVALFIPIFGLWMRLFGTESVDSKNLDRLMSQGIPVGIVPGGFEEATLTTPKENRLYLKNRYGFIKYALKYGTTVYPVFNFGENQLFNTFDRFLSLRLWLNQYKIAAALFWSRFGTLPDPRTKLVSVCGKGLKIPKIPNPTKEDVKKYHDLYIKQLTELYEKYSPLYQPNIPLKIYQISEIYMNIKINLMLYFIYFLSQFIQSEQYNLLEIANFIKYNIFQLIQITSPPIIIEPTIQDIEKYHQLYMNTIYFKLIINHSIAKLKY